MRLFLVALIKTGFSFLNQINQIGVEKLRDKLLNMENQGRLMVLVVYKIEKHLIINQNTAPRERFSRSIASSLLKNSVRIRFNFFRSIKSATKLIEST